MDLSDRQLAAIRSHLVSGIVGFVSLTLTKAGALQITRLLVSPVTEALPFTQKHAVTEMRSGACRALASLADATAAVVQQGVRVWARPEALAGVLRARFEELPATAAAAAGGTGAGDTGRPRLTLRERLDFQFLSFKVGSAITWASHHIRSTAWHESDQYTQWKADVFPAACNSCLRYWIHIWILGQTSAAHDRAFHFCD